MRRIPPIFFIILLVWACIGCFILSIILHWFAFPHAPDDTGAWLRIRNVC